MEGEGDTLGFVSWSRGTKEWEVEINKTEKISTTDHKTLNGVSEMDSAFTTQSSAQRGFRQTLRCAV